MGVLNKLLLYPPSALGIEAKVAEIGTIFSWKLGLREITSKGTPKLS